MLREKRIHIWTLYKKGEMKMTERTINGLPLNEIWEQLGAEFPQEDIKRHPSTNMEYVSVEKIEERLNRVVGMGNWNFLTDPPQICRFGKNNHESCIVSGRLILYDDNRIPIVRSTCGASDIIYPNGSDRPTSVANVLDSAVQDVFKRCAKRFGIAKKVGNSKHTDNRRRRDRTEKLMKVTFLEEFRALPKGGVKSKVTYGEETLEMIIWSKEWKHLQEKYGNSFRVGVKLNEITFYGVEKEYRGAVQLEFVRLPDNGGKGAA